MKRLFAILLAITVVLSFVTLTSCGEPEKDIKSSASKVIKSKSLTCDDHMGNAITVRYPVTFKYDKKKNKGEYFGQNVITKCGTLVGKDYDIRFAYGELYEKAYKNFDEYVKQFKNNDIYEEKELDGHKSYIRQDGDYYIQVLVTLDETEYFCIEVEKENGKNKDYQAIYKSKVFQKLLNSLRFGKAEDQGPQTTEKGHLSFTPTTGWHKGDAQYDDSVTVYNDKISPVTYVAFIDNQLNTVEAQMEYILEGYEDYEFRQEVIGKNTYNILEADDSSFLVAESSTGKAIEIEVRNCTLDDANELLETVKIK